MARYLFEIAYDGTNYHGWQRQKNAISVQEVVEEALTRMCRESMAITGSGRTDTGVHCEQQFFHADFSKNIDTAKWQDKLNSYLPPDISIQSVQQIPEGAHARFDAVKRAYQYRITTAKWPFLKGHAYYYTKPVDIKTMNEAAALLVGEQDFQAFSRVKTEVNNFICTIEKAKWWPEESELFFDISANRFLRGMVRAVVGTLLQVGTGKLSVGGFKAIIESKDRKNAGSAAPAEGLFLTSVSYPASILKK